jgi:hypothetical protein
MPLAPALDYKVPVTVTHIPEQGIDSDSNTEEIARERERERETADVGTQSNDRKAY